MRNCLLFDPEAEAPAPGSLLLEGERIAARLRPDEAVADAEVVDLGGLAVAPGFVDVHFHGRAIFAEPAGSRDALRHDAASCLAGGTTAFLTTTVALPSVELAVRVEALAAAVAAPLEGARPLGIHLEGPWIQPAALGAQPSAGARDPDLAEAGELLARAAGLLRMVTLAPELPGADRLAAQLAEREVVVALGHSLASAEQVDAAVRCGARHVTHLFNAMGPIQQRAPGLAGAALVDDRLSCDAICDGVHVDPRMLRLAARAKGDRLLWISDRIDPPASGDAFGSGPLRDDGSVWRLADGRLAGSRTTLAASIAAARAGSVMTRHEAIAACTLRPARLLGLEAELGTLRPGARADLVVLEADDSVRETWLAGAPAFARDSPLA